mmetsp:Transcript_43544/g.138661  ORF Transcript_43544/g.138661 Transcript_43544/m.138661 type:complete len:158 (+) Transcript_43544:97-570(+)
MAGEARTCADPPARWRRRDREPASAEREPAPSAETASPAMPGQSPPAEFPEGPAGVACPVATAADRAKLDEAKRKPAEPCPVCLEGFERPGDGGMPRTCRRCGSNFHQACLSEWARKEQQLKWEQKPWMRAAEIESGSCPCCRSNRGHDRSRRWARK